MFQLRNTATQQQTHQHSNTTTCVIAPFSLIFYRAQAPQNTGQKTEPVEKLQKTIQTVRDELANEKQKSDKAIADLAAEKQKLEEQTTKMRKSIKDVDELSTVLEEYPTHSTQGAPVLPLLRFFVQLKSTAT